MTAERVARTSAVGLLLAGLAIGALFGFGVGSRVTSSGAPAPSPTGIGTVLDVRPDTVSQRLRDAYYAGGGSVSVCQVADEVACTPAPLAQSVRDYSDAAASFEPGLLTSLTPVEVGQGRIIVAGDFGPVPGGSVVRVEGDAVVDQRLLVVVNPDRQGIDYVDLGTLDAGTYVISIYVPTWRDSPTAVVEIVVR